MNETWSKPFVLPINAVRASFHARVYAATITAGGDRAMPSLTRFDHALSSGVVSPMNAGSLRLAARKQASASSM
jgi:hypothetical protein